MDYKKEAIKLHRELKGKIEVISRCKVSNKDQLSTAYTPGVAEPCLEIAKDESLAYEYTRVGNLVAVITDGTAVLGLGDIGPSAAMPVMEGKCVLFKEFADVDAFPICINSKDTDEIVKTVENIAKSFGGINLEDISAPRCFEIERRLKESLNIPVFHDDQHGTAVVTLAGILNALKLTNKDIAKCSAVINGSGAAGIACAKLLMKMGLKSVIMCDRTGAIYDGRDNLNEEKQIISKVTNLSKIKGSLTEVLKNADIFIGVSAPNCLTADMVKSMNKDAIIFAMANPTPEIMPDVAKEAGAAVVGTGRSDFPNQINNVLAFPGIFRGAFDVGAKEITDNMKIAAAYAIANIVGDDLCADMIIPSPFNTEVAIAVAKAVGEQAKADGVCK